MIGAVAESSLVRSSRRVYMVCFDVFFINRSGRLEVKLQNIPEMYGLCKFANFIKHMPLSFAKVLYN